MRWVVYAVTGCVVGGLVFLAWGTSTTPLQAVMFSLLAAGVVWVGEKVADLW